MENRVLFTSFGIVILQAQMKTSVLRGFLSILSTKIGTLLLGLVITPILVRLLGSSLYGDYAFILSIFGLTMILVNAGIFDGVRKYIAENRDQNYWAEHVFGFYLRIGTILAVTSALLFSLAAWLRIPQNLFGNTYVAYFYLLALLIISRQTYSIARSGLIGLGLETRSEPLKIIQKVLFGITAIFLASIGYGVVGVLAGHVIASVVVSGIALTILALRLNLRSTFGQLPSDLPRREFLSFNGWSVVLIFLTASLYHVDILLLRVLDGSQTTGYYKAALTIAEFLWLVPNVLQMVFLHSSSELWSNGDSDRVSNLISRATRYNISLMILLTMGLAALASDFIPLYYGEAFSTSTLPLLLLLPGVLGFALARPIFAVGQGKGALKTLITATGIASLLNIFLNVLLIPRYGAAGAAIATSIGYGSMFLLHVRAARKIGFDPLNDTRIVRIVIITILTAPIIFGATWAIDSALLALLVVPPLGFLVYALLTIKSGVVTMEEIEQIAERMSARKE